jgi:hypothetical protein
LNPAGPGSRKADGEERELRLKKSLLLGSYVRREKMTPLLVKDYSREICNEYTSRMKDQMQRITNNGNIPYLIDCPATQEFNPVRDVVPRWINPKLRGKLSFQYPVISLFPLVQHTRFFQEDDVLYTDIALGPDSPVDWVGKTGARRQDSKFLIL